MPPPTHIKSRLPAAFTLVEVMVSMVVLAIMMMLIAQIIGVTQRSWRAASSRLSQFREARIAFDTITRNMRQATLNAYRDFHYAGTDSSVPALNSPSEAPDGYRRISELAFVSGPASGLVSGGVTAAAVSGHAVFFQAPLGVTDPDDVTLKVAGRNKYENLKHLLCGRGYFIQFGDDAAYRPSFLPARVAAKTRYRLMEYQPPADKNTIYDSVTINSWFEIDIKYLRPVSDKIVGLILSPRLSAGDDPIMVGGASVKPTSIATNYSYDSRVVAEPTVVNPQGTQHMLPPVVKVTMVALDDTSMEQLVRGDNSKVSLAALNSAIERFNNAAGYESDMAALKSLLDSGKLNYRIFESAIVIPASRWTL